MYEINIKAKTSAVVKGAKLICNDLDKIKIGDFCMVSSNDETFGRASVSFIDYQNNQIYLTQLGNFNSKGENRLLDGEVILIF